MKMVLLVLIAPFLLAGVGAAWMALPSSGRRRLLIPAAGVLLLTVGVVLCPPEAGKKEAGELFFQQQREFEQVAAQVLAADSGNGAELPRGVHRISVGAGQAESRYVDFEMGGAGLGPATAYWGVIYTTGTAPVGFQGVALDYVWDGGGWVWWEPGGDNQSCLMPLAPHWYAYEMRF